MKTRLKKNSGKNPGDAQSDSDQEYKLDDSSDDNRRKEDSDSMGDMYEGEGEENELLWDSRKKSASTKQEDFGGKEIRETRMKYLLSEAQKFAQFMISKEDEPSKVKQTKAKNVQSKRRSATHKAEDEEDQKSAPLAIKLPAQPPNLKNGTLKPFQLDGLNWLINLYENGINGILADDMGLGKTIQSISFLAYLIHHKDITGPFLIITPKSTLPNWMNEFKKWLPNTNVVMLLATKEEREITLKKHIQTGKFDVCLTSYQGAKSSLNELRKFKWKYLILDEAHSIKNEESQLSQIVRLFQTNHRLLLTGTPLQNNLHELWSLLNFLLPDLFSSSDIFDEWFNQTAEEKEKEEKSIEMISQLHTILKPFMLRRTKAEADKTIPPKKEMHILVGLTELQLSMYKNMLMNKDVFEGEGKNSYLNVLMQLRKICIHPYLFDGVEDRSLPPLGEHLITVSSKMMVLDKLLRKLKKEGEKVLIFSQMTSFLDILEDYMHFKRYEYCRLDGSTDLDDRERQMKEFNADDGKKFVFMLSTRAGGLGINLASASTVIIFDSDWNPQVDLQAMDRAHRIGQKKQVNVFRLICENTVEEKIIERQAIKLKWDNLVIQQGKFQLGKKQQTLSKENLKEIIMYGAKEILRFEKGSYLDKDIDALLKQGEERAKKQEKEIDDKLGKHGGNIMDLAINPINLYDFENVDYQKKKKEDELALKECFTLKIEKGRRDKKEEVLDLSDTTPNDLIKKYNIKFHLTKNFPTHQFYDNPERLLELSSKAHLLKMLKTKVKQDSDIPDNFRLTEKEKAEKKALVESGCIDWSRPDFNKFLRGCENYGRCAFSKISQFMGNKTEEEVEKYSEKFWINIKNLPNNDRIVKNIEKGEEKLEQIAQAIKLIKYKCSQYKNPMEDLELDEVKKTGKRKGEVNASSAFTNIQDRKLLVYNYIYGYCEWDAIRSAMKKDPILKFDNFINSRKTEELTKRLHKIIQSLDLEKKEDDLKNENGKKKPPAVAKAGDKKKNALKPPVGKSIKNDNKGKSTTSTKDSEDPDPEDLDCEVVINSDNVVEDLSETKTRKSPRTSAPAVEKQVPRSTNLSSEKGKTLKQGSLLQFGIRSEKRVDEKKRTIVESEEDLNLRSDRRRLRE